MLLSEIIERIEHLIKQLPYVRNRCKHKLNLVHFQYPMLKHGLSGREEAGLDPTLLKEGKNVQEMIAIAIVKGQKNWIRRQVLMRSGHCVEQVLNLNWVVA